LQSLAKNIILINNSPNNRAQTGENDMHAQFKEVSKEHFFITVGLMDVRPVAVGEWPYTSLWKTRDGNIVGKSVGLVPASKGLEEKKYFILTQ